MKPILRHIAVTVVAARDGRFGWQLLEQDREGQWKVLEKGDGALPRYAQAMSAGLERLQAMVDDLAVGPVHPAAKLGKSSSSSKSGGSRSADGAQPADPNPGSARSALGTLFGFGPLK